MWTQIRALGLAFWSPGQALDQLNSDRHPWVVQFLLISVQSSMLAIAYRFTFEISFQILPTEVPQETLDALVNNLRVLRYVAVFLGILQPFLWWYAVAGVLWTLNVLLAAREQPFLKMLNLAVLSSVFLVLCQGYLLLILLLRDRTSYQSLQDLQVPIGLNLIPGEWSPFWWAFLGHINLFEVASTLLAAYGFVRMTKASTVVSYTCIFSIWLAWSALRSY